jgi:AcrR family transcriptional regulator
MAEFARGGIHGVSTEAIAERAGVSQPYLFKMFGTKKALFRAAIERRSDQIEQAFRDAAESAVDGQKLDAMGEAYSDLMSADPDALRCQLHAWAASGDPDIRETTQRCYAQVWREVQRLSGEDEDTVRDFIAKGMLLTVAASIELPEIFSEPGWAQRHG